MWFQIVCPSSAIAEQMLIFQFRGLLRIHDRGKLYIRVRTYSSSLSVWHIVHMYFLIANNLSERDILLFSC